jgi:hypothetical protein
MNRIRFRLLISIAVLALLVAACGDDGGSPFASSTSVGETTTTAGGTAATIAGGEETPSTAAREETTTTAGPPGGSQDIEDLLAQFQQVPLRTTYLMGDDREEMTFSQDPTQSPPVSAVLFEGGKMITIGDRYIMCSGEGAGSQCFESPTGGGLDMATAMLGSFGALALSLQGMTDTPGVDVETQQVTIAGRTGVCFTYRPEAITGSDLEFARQCIDTELGFALLMEVKEAGSDEVERVMELIAVGQPEPDDFEPTGPVMTMPEG